MSRFTKLFAATAVALSVGVFAAPLASAATTPSADPIGGGGSVVICLPLGSATICI